MKTVYLAEALMEVCPDVFKAITSALKENGVNCDAISGTKNIWLRDYAPVISEKLGCIKFKYVRHGFPQLRVPEDLFRSFNQSYLVADGGNIEQGEKHVLMTDMVFKQNKELSESFIKGYIETVFRKDLVILPHEPCDTLGHIDGICRFTEGNRVLFNDYSAMDDRRYNVYQAQCEKILSDAGLSISLMPYAYNECPKMSEIEFREKYPHGDEFNPSAGYYINFMVSEKVVLVPQFGFQKDVLAIDVLQKHFPKSKVIGIHCFDLAMMGGLINCVTAQM